jgi:excisionase family DNA binding protein
MADYSGRRSCDTRGVFPAPSSFHRFFGVWSTPGKHFRGGTLPLSDETVEIRRLHSQPLYPHKPLHSGQRSPRWPDLLTNLIESPWMTSREAAIYLRVESRTLLMWARQGKVRAHQLSGTRRHVWRFLRSDLDATMTPPTAALSKRRIQ